MTTDTLVEVPTLRVILSDRPGAVPTLMNVDQQSFAIELLPHDGSAPTLGDLANLIRAMDVLWKAAYSLAAYRENFVIMAGPEMVDLGLRPGPQEIRISRQSPTWMELIGAVLASSGVAATTYGLLRAFLNKPEQIGAMLPRIIAGWHMGWTEAEIAERQRVLQTLPAQPRHAQVPRLNRLGEIETLSYHRGIPDEMQETRILAAVAGHDLEGLVAHVETTGADDSWAPPF